jgi:hypothetical protein
MDDEFSISVDEKVSIQARRRNHPTQNSRPRTPLHVEDEYFRCGRLDPYRRVGCPSRLSPRQTQRPTLIPKEHVSELPK